MFDVPGYENCRQVAAFHADFSWRRSQNFCARCEYPQVCETIRGRNTNKKSPIGTRSESGNAVAIVLLVLAVVSILGTGLLIRSNMDTRFSAAYKSHERLFNLADGGAAVAYAWIDQFGSEPARFDPTGSGIASTLPLMGDDGATSDFRDVYRQFFNVKKPDTTIGSRPSCPAVERKGMYWPGKSYLGYTKEHVTGEGFKERDRTDFWIAEGLATSERSPNPNPFTATRLSLPRAQTSVQIAMTKLIRRSD